RRDPTAARYGDRQTQHSTARNARLAIARRRALSADAWCCLDWLTPPSLPLLRDDDAALDPRCVRRGRSMRRASCSAVRAPSPYGQVVDWHAEQDHSEHGQRRPAAGWIRDRVHEEIQRGEHEEHRGDRVAGRSEGWRVLGWPAGTALRALAPAKDEDRRHAQRVEWKDRRDEGVGELLEGAKQHEHNAERRRERDGDVGTLVPRVHGGELPEEQAILRHGEKDTRRREDRAVEGA